VTSEDITKQLAQAFAEPLPEAPQPEAPQPD
jgi:hypothetical protein